VRVDKRFVLSVVVDFYQRVDKLYDALINRSKLLPDTRDVSGTFSRSGFELLVLKPFELTVCVFKFLQTDAAI
jgi:uncharacterized protein YktA (UPF0223 family)